MYAFDHIITEEKIITDDKSIDQIIEEIADRSQLHLIKDSRSAFQKKMDHYKTTLKQIRF